MPNRSLLLSVAMVLIFSGPVPAQSPPGEYRDATEMPQGILGERVRALIAAVNADDPASVDSFFEAHVVSEFREMFPMEEHRAMFRDLGGATGGVDFYSVRTYTPPRPQTVLIVRDRLFEGWHGISFRLTEPGQKITEINFSPARPPAADAANQAPLSESDLIRTLEEKVDRLCREDRFSGAILIARGDRVIWERACGEATKAWHIPNRIDTKFNLGSMNKMFTATSAMQLVEKGKLKLDDPISKYVDESWLPREITDRVKVRHLLTHTSGLGSYFNETYMESSRDLFRQLDDYKRLVQGDTLAFEPGAQFQYSNTGMLLLGVVVEKAAGQNYFEYIREHVYEPAGMTGSDCYELDRPTENLAEGYFRDEAGEWKNNLYLHVLKGGPAGGGYSTVRDLYQFTRALQGGKLVSRASMEEMWRDHAGNGYGFGFGVFETPAGRIVGHGGGFTGLNSNLDIFLDRELVVVVMSNYDMGAEPLKGYIRRLVGRLKA